MNVWGIVKESRDLRNEKNDYDSSKYDINKVTKDIINLNKNN